MGYFWKVLEAGAAFGEPKPHLDSKARSADRSIPPKRPDASPTYPYEDDLSARCETMANRCARKMNMDIGQQCSNERTEHEY